MRILHDFGAFPEGELRAVYLHWTAGDYTTIYPAYHYCVALGVDGFPVVHATADLSSNMRDVRTSPDPPYVAHTSGRNSFAAGIAVACMLDATPADFGRFPIRDDLVEGMCEIARSLCAYYDLPIDPPHVLTHAEAALEDGYFGSAPEERWDIARLMPEDRPLEPADAARIGDVLRARIRNG